MSDPDRSERRRDDRKPVNASLTVSAGEGQAAAAEVNDVSSLGCNLRLDAEWMRMGKFVTVSMDKSFSVSGVVRWSRDGVHGVEFLRPLPNTVLEELETLCG